MFEEVWIIMYYNSSFGISAVLLIRCWIQNRNWDQFTEIGITVHLFPESHLLMQQSSKYAHTNCLFERVNISQQ